MGLEKGDTYSESPLEDSLKIVSLSECLVVSKWLTRTQNPELGLESLKTGAIVTSHAKYLLSEDGPREMGMENCCAELLSVTQSELISCTSLWTL